MLREFPHKVLDPRILLELTPITLPKDLPTGRVMTEPATQFLTGSQIFQPTRERQRGFGEPAGPEPIHQVPGAVLRGRRIVHAFEKNPHAPL